MTDCYAWHAVGLALFFLGWEGEGREEWGIKKHHDHGATEYAFQDATTRRRRTKKNKKRPKPVYLTIDTEGTCLVNVGELSDCRTNRLFCKI